MGYCIVRVLDERVSNFVVGALFGFARRWTFRSVVFSGNLRASTHREHHAYFQLPTVILPVQKPTKDI